MIGEILKKLRTESKLSQWELGYKLGVSQQAVGQWEKGTREPDSEMVKKIANFFNVTIDYLMGNSTGNTKNLRKVMSISKDVALQFVQKLIKDTRANKLKWKRFDDDFFEVNGSNPVVSFYVKVSSGFVYLTYLESNEENSVLLSINFSGKESNASMKFPYDPEIQEKINELYNEVYGKLPNIEDFF